MHSLINEIFENVFSQLTSQIELHKPIIKLNFEQVFVLYTNKAYIESILLNLLSNSIKYKSENRKLRITITTEKKEDAVVMIFKDNGIGISDADRKLIFDRFHRIESKSSPPQHSTGLGLAIVKSIVDVHGGQLTVWSQLGTGSIFTVKFISSLKIN